MNLRGKAERHHRFPAEERLRAAGEFRRVYDRGISRSGSFLVVFVLAAPDLTRKVGVVAGRRVGGAIRRNRAKRLLRESYRRHRDAVPATGVHLVLVARRACADAGQAEVERDYLRILRRALPSGGEPTHGEHQS